MADEVATFSIGRRSARAILAGLWLLQAHAADDWASPEVLEVGEQFTDLAPPTEAELTELARVISEAFE